MSEKNTDNDSTTELADILQNVSSNFPATAGGSSAVVTGDRAKNIQNMSGGQITINYYAPTEQKEHVESEEELNAKIKTYMKKVYDDQEPVHILLYGNSSVSFHDVYVCNRILVRGNRRDADRRRVTIENATIKDLTEFSNYIIISGTGGLGKSMMMKHILFDTIDHYDSYGLIPIFLDLKDYKNSDSLTAHIHKKINEYFTESTDAGISFNSLVKLLEAGRCVLLLDGLDELSSDVRRNFEDNLEKMLKGYGNSIYVISSRPYSSSDTYRRFYPMELCPFNQAQALELVDKLKFREDRPSIKEGFKERLRTDLFRSHKSFIQNPLLLTIMLFTYELFAEVPTKMHLFYRDAYLALSKNHDANKGLTRELYTGLTSERFEKYFAEFCARTFMKEEYQFTSAEFDAYFNQLKERKTELAKGKTVTAEQFKLDLTRSMCLMNYEEYTYYFTHRSFQEYFCAVYFAAQDDEYLGMIGESFENECNSFGERAFEMLYEMKPRQVEKYVFLPKLEKMLGEREGRESYFTFLRNLYPVLTYSSIERLGFNEEVYETGSFIINSIIQMKKMNRKFYGGLKLPALPEYVKDEFFRIEPKNVSEDRRRKFFPRLVSTRELENFRRHYVEDDFMIVHAGYVYQVETDAVLNSPSEYQEFLSCLEAESFPLKEIYNELWKYLLEIRARQEVKGSNLFDFLG